MNIRNIAFAAATFAVVGLGLATYAQTKPVSGRTSVAVYKSPT